MQTTISADPPVVVHTSDTNVKMEDVLNATRYWFTHADFDPTRAVVWDLNDCFVDLTLEEMRNAYRLVRENVDTKRAGGRTAWVHNSAMVRAMIDIVSEEFDWGSRWGTFDHVDSAVAWCLEDDPE